MKNNNVNKTKNINKKYLLNEMIDKSETYSESLKKFCEYIEVKNRIKNSNKLRRLRNIRKQIDKNIPIKDETSLHTKKSKNNIENTTFNISKTNSSNLLSNNLHNTITGFYKNNNKLAYTLDNEFFANKKSTQGNKRLKVTNLFFNSVFNPNKTHRQQKRNNSSKSKKSVFNNNIGKNRESFRSNANLKTDEMKTRKNSLKDVNLHYIKKEQYKSRRQSRGNLGNSNSNSSVLKMVKIKDSIDKLNSKYYILCFYLIFLNKFNFS